MTDPDVLKRRPYWQYLVGDSKKHRKEHLKLNGLILPAMIRFGKRTTRRTVGGANAASVRYRKTI